MKRRRSKSNTPTAQEAPKRSLHHFSPHSQRRRRTSEQLLKGPHVLTITHSPSQAVRLDCVGALPSMLSKHPMKIDIETYEATNVLRRSRLCNVSESSRTTKAILCRCGLQQRLKKRRELQALNDQSSTAGAVR